MCCLKHEVFFSLNIAVMHIFLFCIHLLFLINTCGELVASPGFNVTIFVLSGLFWFGNHLVG